MGMDSANNCRLRVADFLQLILRHGVPQRVVNSRSMLKKVAAEFYLMATIGYTPLSR